jgi:ubiquitin-protein ligase
LPQLLTYPNPASPLNHDAAELFEKDLEIYGKKVREVVAKYALNEEFKEEGKEPIEE